MTSTAKPKPPDLTDDSFIADHPVFGASMLPVCNSCIASAFPNETFADYREASAFETQTETNQHARSHEPTNHTQGKRRVTNKQKTHPTSGHPDAASLCAYIGTLFSGFPLGIWLFHDYLRRSHDLTKRRGAKS